MNDDDKKARRVASLAVVFILIGYFVGVATGMAIDKTIWHADAIKRGFAEYHSQTGKFQWKGEG